jgi:serine/threonine protein kinase
MKVVNDFDLKSGGPGMKIRQVPFHSPFVAGRKFALQSPTGLRIFQDYIPGGELFKVLKKPGGFSEKEIQFYIAELLLGLEELHRWGIQDYCLRPKKILLDSLGHVVLSDFGLSVANDQVERILDAYSAPESFSTTETNHLQNFWTLGIILLEMIFGYNPFQSMDVKETRKNILKGVVNLPQTKRSLAKGEGSQDLCRKLLRRNPQKRLGSTNGTQDIKMHSFFADIDWAELRAKRVEPPLKPAVKIDPASVWKASLDTLTERFESSINLEASMSVPDVKEVSGSFNLSTTHISSNSDSFHLSNTHISANSEGAASYQSALSHESPSASSVYATPSSRIHSLARGSGPAENSLLTKILSRSDKGLNPDSKFGRLLQERGLLLPPTEQLDWSGRGQHVEFRANELIPLKPLAAVGHGGSAMVDSVLCRRIKLARKVMVCNRRQKLETMINEVEHLQRLRHPHIVQLVGSYIQGSKFAILLYPVADWNLATFYELCSVEEGEVCTSIAAMPRVEYLNALSGFFPCLAHGLAYIHANTMKHLDVKPQNVLVRRIDNDETPFRVYL